MRARVGAAESPLYGPTWLFHTPISSAPGGIDVSHLGHCDLNGDGFDDIVRLRESGAGDPAMLVHLGSRSGVSVIPSQTIMVIRHEYLSWTCDGDLNGDGRSDLVIGAPMLASRGIVRLYSGTDAGVTAAPTREWIDREATGYFGMNEMLGDINGDGYGDLGIAAIDRTIVGFGEEGELAIYRGGPAGPALTPDEVYVGRAQAEHFGPASSLGDINGDGFSDFFVHADNNVANSYLFLGGATAPRTPLRPPLGFAFRAYDVNLDGYSDFILNGNLTFGRATPFTWSDPPRPTPYPCRDVNGDGIVDYGGATETASIAPFTQNGMYRLFLGTTMGPPASPSQIIAGLANFEGFGTDHAPAGDVNGDGFDDILVYSRSLALVSPPPTPQTIRLYLGSPTGLVTPAHVQWLWSYP